MDVNIIDLIEEHGSEEKCREYLEALRWPSGPACLRCRSLNAAPILHRSQYRCRGCGYHFSVTAGTIFQDSHLPLTRWFLTTYMMIESKKSISANKIKRTIGVSYKTAWYLCHRIRKAMEHAAPASLKGIVEVDETYVGGNRRRVGSGRRVDKTIASGAVGRSGGIRLHVVPQGHPCGAFSKFATEVTDPTASVYTDESQAYRNLGKRGRAHESVNHSAGEYVRGDLHTNTVESAWSFFQQSIVGAYHQISTKHMPKYLDEQAWRFDNRCNEYLFRDTLLKLLEAKGLPFKTLVNE